MHGGNDFQSSYITFGIFNNSTYFGTTENKWNMTINFDSTYYIILIISFSNHIYPNKDFYESWDYSRKLVQAVIPYEWEWVANAVWVYEKL